MAAAASLLFNAVVRCQSRLAVPVFGNQCRAEVSSKESGAGLSIILIPF